MRRSQGCFSGSSGGGGGAAGLGGDQEPAGIRVVRPSAVLPLASGGLHRELGGVVVGADVDPSAVVGHVVDRVGDRLQTRVGEEQPANSVVPRAMIAVLVPEAAATRTIPPRPATNSQHLTEHRDWSAGQSG